MKYTVKMLFNMLIVLLLFASCSGIDMAKPDDNPPLIDEPQVVIETEEGPIAMPLEEYITGVVAAEMAPGWHRNAYGAQAIIARTFALSYMKENKTNILSTDFKETQAYKPENINPIIEKAVRRTRGQVAIYGDDYVKGFFHSNAGGRTTLPSVGLEYFAEDPPYIHSVTSPDNLADASILNWHAEFPEKIVRQAIAKMLAEEIDSINEINPRDIAICGRAKELQVKTAGNEYLISAPALRLELGSEEIKSTHFVSIGKTGNNFVFCGTGFGHGVGMSQYGAQAMARRGNSPQDIVRYFFRNIKIKRMYK